MAESFILGALKRGRSVEPFLGPCGSTERPGARFVDLGEFPPFDPDDESVDFGRHLGLAVDPLTALIIAEQGTGAERGRWVNESVAQDEYGDFVRDGRPADASPEGHPWPAVPDVP
ncbi:hypothetical protein ACFYU9_05745 [Streptomyces sp. NPDC004327]|uniref:hypothetical protein n=1 Tax=Streptomyces sp. NPDC004327 TaxID=3364699 RepID=UPI003696F221